MLACKMHIDWTSFDIKTRCWRKFNDRWTSVLLSTDHFGEGIANIYRLPVFHYAFRLWHLSLSAFQVIYFVQKSNETCWMAEQTASTLLAPQYTTDRSGQAFMPQTVTNSKLKATTYSLFLKNILWPFPVTQLREISYGCELAVVTEHKLFE
jgi:hypothetical protein